MDLEQAAKAAAGNWKNFDSFYWCRSDEVDDPDAWTIVYTSNRDSTLLAESNTACIDRTMEPYTDGDDPDVVHEHHSHYLCGHVDGYSIRVYRDGKITPAFETYWGLMECLRVDPVLDESDYSSREYAATLVNIREAAIGVVDLDKLPNQWEADVFSWFWDHDQSAVENTDDSGGYPDEEQIKTAMIALGFIS